jgi:hypothetical protein
MKAETAMSRKDPEETESVDEQSEETESKNHHLTGVEDGAGCTEIWEHLSRGRRAKEEARNAEADDD